MKHFLLFTFSLLTIQRSYSCDDELIQFKKDCIIQDRYIAVRDTFRSHGLDITDVGEYRGIRLIDRKSWEENIASKQIPIKMIYAPAPFTWNIWNEGVNAIFSSDENRGKLTENLSDDNWLDNNFLSNINKKMLANGVISVKDSGSDHFLKPGMIRSYADAEVGFCWRENLDTLINKIKQSNQSLEKFEKEWIKRSGISIKEAIKQMGGKKYKEATMITTMAIMPKGCLNGNGNWVNYLASKNVRRNIEWLRYFLKYNLEQYNNKKPILSPVELAAIAQKWLVSIHPFADGNGRTSRILQDLILSNFDLPFAPAGDLQNDTLEKLDNYMESNYLAIEKILSRLEKCALDLNEGNKLDYRCKSTSNINK